MSHKNQCTQQWKAEKMDQAQALWKANDNLPPDHRLSMRAIAKKVGIGKATIIERLSGRRQGSGHIARGKHKARILTKGKQAGHQAGHFNHFNQTSKQVIKQVIKWVIVWYFVPLTCLMIQSYWLHSDQNKKMTFTMCWCNLHGEASHSQTSCVY